MVADRLGVVAIGLDEGQRLHACLAAAIGECSTVVYVDAGSRDRSIEVACSLGVDVIALEPKSFSPPGRCRNAGFSRIRQLAPEIEYVQFVDGDCELVAGWLAAAAAELDKRPRAAAVCGRRRERHPRASIYHRLLEVEWDTPVGEVPAFGGDVLVRAVALAELGGFHPGMLGGEEPELCLRLRASGWTIHRVGAEMTLHDAAMTRFGQWWARNKRAGHAYAHMNALSAGGDEQLARRELASIRFWTLAPPLAYALALGGIVASGRGSRRAALIPLSAYPAQALKIALRQVARGRSPTDALLYAAGILFGKFPQHAGLRRFRSSRHPAHDSGAAPTSVDFADDRP